MAKKIIVQEVAVDKDLLKEMNATPTAGLLARTGYDVLGINGNFYIDEAVASENLDTLTALLNNTETSKEPAREKVIELAECDRIEKVEAPEFGVTIDENFNIQQLNLALDDVRDDSGLAAITDTADCSYWDLNEKLHVNGREYDKKKISSFMSAIKAQGYSNPIVLHADKSSVRTYYHDMMTYIYVMLGATNIPVRVITYKDIRYVEKISPVLYEGLKKIPANVYYKPEDEKDVSELMIDNYSDKREIIKQFAAKELPQLQVPAVIMNLQNLTEVIPYMFTGEMAKKNEEYIKNVTSHKFPDVCTFEDGHMADALSISESMYRYLNGYAPICPIGNCESLQESNLEVAEEIEFDPALYPIDTFDYVDSVAIGKTKKGKNYKAIMEKFGDGSALVRMPNQLFGMSNIHTMLKDGNIKIKMLKEKQ